MDEFDSLDAFFLGQDEQPSDTPKKNSNSDDLDAFFLDDQPKDNGLNRVVSGTDAFIQGAGSMLLSSPLKSLGELTSYEDTDSNALYQAGEAIDKWIKKNFPINPAYADEFFTTDVMQGLGSFAGIGLGQVGNILKATRLLGFGMAGTSAEGVDEYKRILDARGEDQNAFERKMVALGNGLVGITEKFPVEKALNRLDRMSGEGVRKVLIEAGKGGFEELVQEGTQSFLKNVIAKGVYDPDRPAYKDVLHDAEVGGVVGFLASLITASWGSRKIRSKAEVEADEKEKQDKLKEQKKQRDQQLKDGASASTVQQTEEEIADTEDDLSTLDLEKQFANEDEAIHEDTDVPEGAQNAGAVIGVEEDEDPDDDEDELSPSEQDQADDSIILRDDDPDDDDPDDPDGGTPAEDDIILPKDEPESVDDSEPEAQPPPDAPQTGNEVIDNPPEDGTGGEQESVAEDTSSSTGDLKKGRWIQLADGRVGQLESDPDPDGTAQVAVPTKNFKYILMPEKVNLKDTSLHNYFTREAFPVGQRVSTPWGEGVVLENDRNNRPADTVEVRLDDGHETPIKTPLLSHIDAKQGRPGKPPKPKTLSDDELVYGRYVDTPDGIGFINKQNDDGTWDIKYPSVDGYTGVYNVHKNHARNDLHELTEHKTSDDYEIGEVVTTPWGKAVITAPAWDGMKPNQVSVKSLGAGVRHEPWVINTAMLGESKKPKKTKGQTEDIHPEGIKTLDRVVNYDPEKASSVTASLHADHGSPEQAVDYLKSHGFEEAQDKNDLIARSWKSLWPEANDELQAIYKKGNVLVGQIKRGGSPVTTFHALPANLTLVTMDDPEGSDSGKTKQEPTYEHGQFVKTPKGIWRVNLKDNTHEVPLVTGKVRVMVKGPDIRRPYDDQYLESFDPKDVQPVEPKTADDFSEGEVVMSPWGKLRIRTTKMHQPYLVQVVQEQDGPNNSSGRHTINVHYLEKIDPQETEAKPSESDTKPSESEAKPSDSPRQRRRKKRNRKKVELTAEQQKLADDVKGILDEIGKPSQLNSGVDPIQVIRLIAAGTKLGKTYLQQGIIKFEEWADAMLDALDDRILPYLKRTYNQLAGDDDLDSIIDDMDSRRAVMDFDLDTLYDDEADTTNEDDASPPQGDTLLAKFVERLRGEGFKDNQALKNLIAEHKGIKASEVTQADLKEAQEWLEAAVVKLMREAGHDGTKASFDKALELNDKLPLLNIRSSTSSQNQAYSTPAPLSWIASAYVAINSDPDLMVMDTTAGNGSLLAYANPSNVLANELNPERVERLFELGFEPSEGNAIGNAKGIAGGQNPNVVIVNPPFDALDTAITIDGYKVVKLDHQLAAEALQQMAQDGKASIIIGANKEPGGMTNAERPFFNWLYSHFNVVDHFEVEGDLYKKMGAGWPVRVIVVHGKQESDKVAPPKGTIERLDSWDSIYERYRQFSEERFSKEPEEAGQKDGDTSTLGSGNRGGRPSGNTGGGSLQGGTDDQLPDDATAGDAAGATDPGGNQTGVGGVSGNGAGSGGRGTGGSSGGSGGVQSGDSNADQSGGLGSGGQSQTDTHGSGKTNNEKTKSGNVDGDSGLASDYQTEYNSKSTGFNEGILTPRNMADPLEQFLEELAETVGPIDDYVMKELGYDSVEQMHKGLMGLQVDAVASAIFNIKRRSGIVIADQTGVGKGRQAAAVIRYARRNGLVPVFITVKPNLFTDMNDDLQDIGEEEIRPFIFNDKVGVQSKNELGEPEVLYRNTTDQRRDGMSQVMQGEMPEGKNSLWLTYSQLGRMGNSQQRALRGIADKSIFVLDEAHNAAGADSNTGTYMRELLMNAQGALYLSATWAKRPDNIPLYFLTAIRHAVNNIADLPAIMQQGGLPMQTIVSSMLAREGQLFRRERSFKGIQFKTKILGADDQEEITRQTEISNAITDILRDVVTANSAFLDVDVEAVAEAAVEETGASIDTSGNNNAASAVSGGNFNSVTHNYIKQLLYGLKLEKAADEAIAAHERGEKPFIVVDQTFGSFHQQYIASNNLRRGQSVAEFGYHNIIERMVDRSRRVKVVDRQGNDHEWIVPLDHPNLSATTRLLYEKIYDKIESARILLGDLPGSPIDYLHYRLRKAGLNTDELTGREWNFTYDDEGNVTLDKRNPDDRRVIVDKYNAGELDALIANRAGSTGLSAHAAKKFKDQKQRHMIVLEADLDINQFMQMLGRINRFGQVKLPLYTMLQLTIPAEKRVAAILAMKMQSLNANTTSDTESDNTLKEAIDFLNMYGDQIVHQYLKQNPFTATGLGLRAYNPDSVTTDLARKFLSKSALQPVVVQDAMLAEIEPAYNEYIKYLNDTNQNELKPKVMDLQAEVKEQTVLNPGSQGDTLFHAPVILQKMDVKRLGKPPTWEAVQAAVEEELDGRTGDEYHVALQQKIDGFTEYKKHLDDEVAAATRQLKKKPDSEKAIARKHDADNKLVNYNENRTQFLRVLNELAPGRWVRLLIDSETVEAVPVAIEHRHQKGSGSPYSSSKLVIRFMVNSPVRNVKLPLSRLLAGEPEEKIYRGPMSAEEIKPEEIFTGENLGGNRETRYMMSENLLQGIQETTSKGLVVSYTNKEGTVQQGYLLPRKFDPANDVTDKVALNDINEIIHYIAAARKAGSEVLRFGLRTNKYDAYVHLKQEGQGIELIAPRSRRQGKYLWGDEQLTEITGDFHSRGRTMRVDVLEQKAMAALERFHQLEPLYIMRSQQPMLQQAMGQQVSDQSMLQGETSESSVRFSRGEAGKQTGKKGMKANRVKVAVGDIGLNIKASVRVVQSASELPPHVLQRAGEHSQGADGVQAVFDPATGRNGTIWMVADNLPNPAEARKKLVHEINHFGLRRLLKDPKSLNRVLKQIGRDMDQQDLQQIADLYELDLNVPDEYLEAVEETLSHYAEQSPQAGWVRRAVAKFRRWLRRMFPNMRWSRNDVISLIVEARRASVKPKRQQYDVKPGMGVTAYDDDDSGGSEEDAKFARRGKANVRLKTNLNDVPPTDKLIRPLFQIPGVTGTVNDQNEWQAPGYIRKPVKFTADKMGAFIRRGANPDAGLFSRAIHDLTKTLSYGLLDRRGTPQDFIDRDWKREGETRQWLRKGMKLAEAMQQAGINSVEAAVLYDMVNGEVSSNDPRLQDLSQPIIDALKDMSKMALQYGIITQDSYDRYVGQWMHRSYMKYEDRQSSVGRWVERRFNRRRKKIVGDALKGRGLFEPVLPQRLLKHINKYLPDWYDNRPDPDLKGEKFLVLDKMRSDGRVYRRVYWPENEAIPTEYIDYENKGTFEVRGKKKYRGKEQIILWRDYTRDERVQMGEIMDVRYAAVRSFHTLAHDLATGHFYKDIADNDDWSIEDTPENRANYNVENAPSRWDTLTLVQADWIRVPKTTLAKSATPQWGELAGKLVKPEIWRDLNELEHYQKSNWWKWLLNQWKQNKTTRSLATHANNFFSNFLLMDLMDVRFEHFIDSYKQMLAKGDEYQEAENLAVIGRGMLDYEIRKEYLEPLLKEIRQQTLGIASETHKFAKTIELMTDFAKKVDRKAADFYQFEDDVFRLAAFMKRKSLGDTPEVAARFARDQFVNYDIRAPWINLARETAMPFISYTYRMIPLLANAIATRPWKLAKYQMLSGIAISMAYWLDDEGDEDEEYRSLPEYLQSHSVFGINFNKGRTILGTPKAFRIPFRDYDGDPMFLDVTRKIPGGDIFESTGNHGSLPIWGILQWGGPLMTAAEIMTNVNSFTGKKISDEMTDTDWEKWQKTMKHVYQSWMPTAPYVPGSHYWNRLGRAMKDSETGEVGKSLSGKEYDFGTEFINSIGWKQRGYKTTEQQAFHGMAIERAKREIDSAFQRLNNDLRSGEISQQTFRKKIEKLNRHYEKLGEKAKKQRGQE